ncbi:MAG TPA: hypothetical protein VGA04_30170, partial [Streptosporangiaceae bacterium]
PLHSEGGWAEEDQPSWHLARPADPTRIDAEEFYRLLDGALIDDVGVFNDKLREWEDYYNYQRLHGGLDGQTPYERLLRGPTPRPSPTNVSRTPARDSASIDVPQSPSAKIGVSADFRAR